MAKAITVRLDPGDHRMLSREAARLGVQVGTLSRMMIRAALRGETSLPRSPEAAGGGPIADHKDEILRLAARRGARNVRLFGSHARGDAEPDSDVDLLVEIEPGRSLLDVVGLSQDLEELLGRRVDVVTDAGLSPHLRERIRGEAVPV